MSGLHTVPGVEVVLYDFGALSVSYALASRRFHLDEWDASISRKLQTLDGIYAKMSDRASTRRMELLERIIILLFVVSIALSVITLAPH